MKVSHVTLCRIAAITWFAVSVFLMIKGALLLEKALSGGGGACMRSLTSWTGGAEVAASALIAIGCLVGILKGRVAVAKSAYRLHKRIASLPSPSPVYKLYGILHYLLLLLMISFGLGMRALGVAPEIRGTVLVAVATSLIVGALTLLRLATYDRASQP